MGHHLVFLWFGAIVAVVGFAMVVQHVIQNRRHQANLSLDESDRRFYAQQYQRRLQVSALIVTLGALIGMLGYLNMESRPMLATCYLAGLLLLCVWLALLALSDFVASRVHTSRVGRRQRRLRQALHEALMEARTAHDISTTSTGSDQPTLHQ